MDKISLTDLRLGSFGPTLDESVFYGIDCLSGLFFGSKHNNFSEEEFKLAAVARSESKKAVSDLNLYKPCHDADISGSTSGSSPESHETVGASKVISTVELVESFEKDTLNDSPKTSNDSLMLHNTDDGPNPFQECRRSSEQSRLAYMEVDPCCFTGENIISEAAKDMIMDSKNSSRRSSKDKEMSNKEPSC
ncbi:uncharacterized protein LOC131681373 [Topomyia yanbarensis]|uniref:uncharacterized protein LOC131681373 n=1 Tax=Topomyia yanbarensis TaxID=2498891 RepID=UPI00273C5815|nr:uncharacterized protein LOC131681373 [Topomyia yanbarensis]